MRTKYILLALVAAGAMAFIITVAVSRSHAGYPMISGLANQRIEMNTQTDAIPFNVSDDKTSADDLTLSYTSNTPSLVPANDNHIILGGAGSDRTVQVIPARDQRGTTTITIIVRDTDGETNQDSFSVEVTKPLKIP